MINRVLIAVAVGAVVVSVAVGAALGASGTVDLVGEPSTVVPMDAVSFRICPAGAEVGQLHRGDRIYLTGVDESGGWVELRSPQNLDERVWMQTAYVTADDTLDDLPVVSCGLAEYQLALPGGQTVDVTTTTTTTTTLPEASTTTVDEQAASTTTSRTPTTRPTATSAPPTTKATTTTTTVPATTTTKPTTTTTTKPTTTTTTKPTTTTTSTTTIPKPVIGTPSRSATTIKERYSDGSDYDCGGPSTSSISVSVSGATSVTMSWDVGPQPRSTSMSDQGGVWLATLGPFAETTVPYTTSTTVHVTISAKGPGGSATRGTTVTLQDCTFG